MNLTSLMSLLLIFTIDINVFNPDKKYIQMIFIYTFLDCYFLLRILQISSQILMFILTQISYIVF